MSRKIPLVENNTHQGILDLAEKLIPSHIATEDGEKYFNLFTFIKALENELSDFRVGLFEVDGLQITRYVWCCLWRFKGETPAGTTFRGMPILD